MIDFSTIDQSNQTFPVKPPDSTDEQSSNFVTPYKIGSGTQRGTQGVGFSGPKIDSANNRITLGGIVLDGNSNSIIVNQPDGSINGLGLIPGSTTGETGFYAVDATGHLVWKNVIGTQYYYNPADSYNNSIRIGAAPVDSRTGIWVGKIGQNVTSLLGG